MTEVSRVALVISLSLNIFLLASLVTYGVWVVAQPLNATLRGFASLLVWIVCFGAGTLAFWKIVERISPIS